MVWTGADISLRSVMATMRALVPAIAQLIRAQKALVRGILTIVLSITKLIHCYTLLGEATQPIWVLANHRLVHIKSSGIDMRAVKLIRLVETVRNAVAAQKVRNALERKHASELERSTLAQLLPLSHRVVITLGLIAVSLIAKVQAVVDPIAHVHLAIAPNGPAILLAVFALLLTFHFIGIVSR